MEKAARKIAERLRDRGHIAYFAGGCVRDMVRGLTPKDYDIATDARPENVQALFPRTYAVGAHFGVIIVSNSKWPRFVPMRLTSMADTPVRCNFRHRKKTQDDATSP